MPATIRPLLKSLHKYLTLKSYIILANAAGIVNKLAAAEKFSAAVNLNSS